MNSTATLLAYAVILNGLRKLGFSSQQRIDALRAITTELDTYIKVNFFKKYVPDFHFETAEDFYDTISLECTRFQSICQAMFDASFEGLDVIHRGQLFHHAIKVVALMTMAIEEWDITLDADKWQPLLDDSSLAE